MDITKMDIFRPDFEGDGPLMDSSSDEEEDPRARHKSESYSAAMARKWEGDYYDSSEDEFAVEMEAELNKRVSAANTFNGSSLKKIGQSKEKEKEEQVAGASGEGPKFYDEVYFDSDEEEAQARQNQDPSKKRKKNVKPSKHRVLTNDELLYDPDQDEDNQKWMDSQRRKFQPNPSSGSKEKVKLPRSDAVLNCPACFTLLCTDCQRHELYSSQYRAMFVFNCKVSKSEKLEYQPSKKGRKRGKKGKAEEEQAKAEVYNPVRCTTCDTQVAVRDQEEVYHFFNILASHT